jgi:hypothetical protein
MSNISLFYVMLLNNIIFTPSSTVMWKYFLDEYYVH